MKIGLFDLGQEYQTLYEMAMSSEDSTEELTALLEELEAKTTDKLDATNYIIKELKAKETELKAEAKRLTDKAKVFANKQLRLKDRIKDMILASEQTSIKSDKFNFTVSKIDDFNYDGINTTFLDKKYLKVETELDKTTIKNDFKAGVLVDGLIVTKKDSLKIT